jgi:hypothetical protein
MALLVVLVGCGREPTLEEKSEFEPYIQRWETYSAHYGRDARGDRRVRILFGVLKPNVAGLCEENTFQPPRVLVSREVWKERSDASRETLILHELGHCLLGRDHRNELIRLPHSENRRVSLVPISIMNLRGVAPDTFLASKDYYLRELFTTR